MPYRLENSSLIKELAPPVWRIRNILPSTGLASIYGPSTSGKSFLALDMAAAIAAGQPWFGQRVKPAPVVYVALEGEAGFRLRINAWEAFNQAELSDQLYFVIHQPFKLNYPEDVTELAEACPQGCVIIIDTLNRSAPTANENESHDMGVILEGAKRLQQLTDGLVVLIHHTGKDESKGLRGHSSLLAAMDSTIEVARLNDQREWTVTKSKDGQDGASFGFTLAIEELEYDEDGEVVTSCAIQPSGAPNAKTNTKGPGINQRRILEPVRKAITDEGKLGNPGVPAAISSIPLELAITVAAQNLDGPASRLRARAKEAIDGLISRGIFRSSGTWLWLA